MRFRTAALAGASLLALVIPVAGTRVADANPSRPVARDVSYAYVNGNTLGHNTIDAFVQHGDGPFSRLPGSPFTTSGVGLGAGLGSQGAIQATADGRFLVAVDAASNQLEVFAVGRNGRPEPVGRPLWSYGVKPVSVTISQAGLVYVANVGDGGSNYTGFRLDGHGFLHHIPGSTIAVPEGSDVGQVLFNSTADRLIGTRDTTSLIDSFTVGRDGRLTAAVGSPFPAQDLGPIGSEFRPTNPSQLFVSNAHAGTDAGTVSAFHVSRNGTLTSIGHSPYKNHQTAPCWVEITRDGKYLFSVNTASGSISTFGIQNDGSLTLLRNTVLTNGAGAVDARLSPDGKTLSVTGSSGHVLSTLAVHNGRLTELTGSPVALPANGAPMGLAIV